MAKNDFYESDEPVEDVVAAFDNALDSGETAELDTSAMEVDDATDVGLGAFMEVDATGDRAETVDTAEDVKADKAEPEKVGNVSVETPSAPVADESTDEEGGQSFDYGKPVEETESAQDAAKVAAYDEWLRNQNPDGIVFREAGTSGEIGGESFDYGQPAEAQDES